MTKRNAGKTLLENAYQLSTPDDNIAYYNELASTYDTDFAEGLGYHYPHLLAEIYHKSCTDSDLPIADIGCGTGLVAQALDLPSETIDGIDISSEMLRISENKQIYRNLYEVDLTELLASITNNYGAVISAGTFTSGHVGPKPLIPLLNIARAKALFVIGVNKVFYQKAAFEPVLRHMEATGLIGDLKMLEIPIYAKPQNTKNEHEHSTDTGYAVVYRKN